MNEDKPIDSITPENAPEEAARTDINGSETEAPGLNETRDLINEPAPEVPDDPDPVPLLRENTKQALIIGAALGVCIGILMFLVPNRILEEGARLTISVILILLGPRLIQDKYRLDFTKGRYTMAGGLVLVLIIYILIGHPIN